MAEYRPYPGYNDGFLLILLIVLILCSGGLGLGLGGFCASPILSCCCCC